MVGRDKVALRGALASWVCVAVLALSAGPSVASHVGEDLLLDQQLISTTNQLIATLSQWEKGSAAQRDAGIANLVQLAQQRQTQMILLLRADPTVAGARMLPKPLRAKLPAQAQAYVEQEVHVRGDALAHVSDDFANSRSKIAYKLAGTAGTAELNIYHADPTAGVRELNRMAGRKVALDAMRVGDNLVILDKKRVQIEAAGSTATTGGTTVASASVVQGDQKTLSILLNFNDKAMTCSAADVSNRLFGSTGATVNNNYAESSRGLVSFSGTVVGPYTINYSSTGSCNYTGWASAADAAAKAAGVDPAQYQRVNYVTPGNSTCGWSGLAYMPGKQSWVQSCGSTGMFSHELGHNLSLHHASTPTSEYGDGSDPLGGARVVDHNGANRVMAGWMPAGSVQDVVSGGSYALASISTNSTASSPQVLRLAKADTNEFYYVSLRTPTNLDSGLSSTYLNTLSIHRTTGALPARTYLLQNLAAGQTFSDATNGIAITNQGIAGGTASVAVSLGGAACARTAPAISIGPGSQSAAPGTTVAYSVTVTNLNSAACGTSTFNLGQGLPSGFSGSFAAASLAIAAGSSSSTNWSVAAASNVPDATYTLNASAADNATAMSATNHASYVVYANTVLDTTAPTVSIDSPMNGSTVSGGRVTIGASASDASGIQAVEFYVDGELLARDTAQPYTANWNLRKALSGAHTVRVVAIDNAGIKSESTVTVTK
jgi:Bacterial Ig domain/Gametolysin peptidase M11